jgi:hypothetical protein
MRVRIATLLLTAPLWGQAAPTGDLGEQIRKLQSGLANPNVLGDSQTDLAQRQKDFERIESMAGAYLIVQMEASPETVVSDDLSMWIQQLRWL